MTRRRLARTGRGSGVNVEGFKNLALCNHVVAQTAHLLTVAQRRALLWMPSAGMNCMVFSITPRPPLNVLHVLLALGLTERDADSSGASWRLTEIGVGVRNTLENGGKEVASTRTASLAMRAGRQPTPERCREAREMLGWTIHDLAKHSHTARGTIERFEAGMGLPQMPSMPPSELSA
jgi:DNA-binding XRE family transcriptional regulator